MNKGDRVRVIDGGPETFGKEGKVVLVSQTPGIFEIDIQGRIWRLKEEQLVVLEPIVLKVGSMYALEDGRIYYLAFDRRTIGYVGGYPFYSFPVDTDGNITDSDPRVFSSDGYSPLNDQLVKEYRKPEVVEGYINRYEGHNYGDVYPSLELARRAGGSYTIKTFKALLTEVIE